MTAQELADEIWNADTKEKVLAAAQQMEEWLATNPTDEEKFSIADMGEMLLMDLDSIEAGTWD